ncbi:MAG: recombinase family protein [Synechococcaceae cyanobacterium]|nr:recombinase family protein [Synechococcaceae cyanobacterium]
MAAAPGAFAVRWLAYHRVSTDRQGPVGLGLEAQRAKVASMAAERGAVIAAEFVAVESGRKNDRPQLDAALARARAEKAVIAVARIDRLARDAGFELKLANEAEKNGMGGFVFCDLPDIDATTSACRMVLTMMASVAESEARRISERTREALRAAKKRGVRPGGYREAAARQSAARRSQALAEAEQLRGVLAPMAAASMSYRAMARARAGVGKVSSTGRPLAPARVGRILQRLGLVGKPQGGDLRLVPA